ncbi:hypothetical protein P3T43_007281 [Paraburkholderia sp. GAS41]
MFWGISVTHAQDEARFSDRLANGQAIQLKTARPNLKGGGKVNGLALVNPTSKTPRVVGVPLKQFDILVLTVTEQRHLSCISINRCA